MLGRTRESTLQRLAIRVIEHEDRQAAVVLGDALLERGLDRLRTGRVRMVPFQVIPTDTFRARPVSLAIPFRVRGQETLYNVEGFARRPDESRWDEIFSMLVTSRRDIFVAMQKLPLWKGNIRFTDLVWKPRFGRTELAYNVSLHVKRNAKGKLLKRGRLQPVAIIERLDKPPDEQRLKLSPRDQAREQARATRAFLERSYS